MLLPTHITAILASPSLSVNFDSLSAFPVEIVTRRVEMLFIEDNQDLDAWVDICDKDYPELDIEALDIAIGCC